YSYNGVVSGSGSLMQTGAGTTMLTGVHGYAGLTTVAHGVLALAGSASISTSFHIQVDADAALNVAGLTGGLNHDGVRFALSNFQQLSGTGTIQGGVDFRLNSALVPAEDAGTLTVAGDVDFQPGSNLDVRLDGLTDTDDDRTR